MVSSSAVCVISASSSFSQTSWSTNPEILPTQQPSQTHHNFNREKIELRSRKSPHKKMSTSSASPLDFATLLSRDYRPARVARLIPREKELLKKKTHHSADGDTTLGGDAADGHQQEHHHHHHHAKKEGMPDLLVEDFPRGHKPDDMLRKTNEEDTSRLALQLATKTQEYQRHSQVIGEEAKNANAVDDSDLKKYLGISKALEDKTVSIFSAAGLSPLFHQVELGDWESKISWEGYQPDKYPNNNTTSQGQSADSEMKPRKAISSGHNIKEAATPDQSPNGGTGNGDADSTAVIARKTMVNPMALLNMRRNPFLENISFDKVSWTGDRDDVSQKALSQPLILELGIAGQSIARHVLPAHRPEPHIKSEAYQRRIEEDWKGDGDMPSAAELVAKGSLHADKEKLERLIAQRQEKRRQMAKDKTSRVKEAMGTLDGVLAGGRGRTITSSLMGPGGTERTGRPSRHVGNVSHDAEYVEQLDMITNHVLVRDLSKVSLRQYHRPKLPLGVVRTTMFWQFQIRHIATSKKGAASSAGGAVDTANSSSYQAMMMGTHAGAISKAKLRTEHDLSATEGTLILLEYSEERPPIQLTKGMASKVSPIKFGLPAQLSRVIFVFQRRCL